jgi:hypothetical protein
MPGRTFHSVQETKEFIASAIAAQAQRDAVPFSEIERKMLLFSEAGWAPPDIMEVNDEFERQYDSDEYEKKVSTLIQHLDKRLQKENAAEYSNWKSAVKYLRSKDHYINVMIEKARLHAPGDQWKLFLSALAVAAGLIGLSLIAARYNFQFGQGHRGRRYWWDDSHDILMWMWAAVWICAAFFAIVRWFIGAKRADRLFDHALNAVFRVGKRFGL